MSLRLMRIGFWFIAVCVLAVDSAFALREVGFVRVISETSTIRRLRQVDVGNIATVTRGTVLEIMDREGDWYWVLLEPNEFGTRRPGWIRAQDVEELPDPVRSSGADQVQAPSPAPVVTEGDRREAFPTEQVPSPATTSVTLAKLDLEVVVNFAFDSSVLSDEATGKLDEMVAQMKAGAQNASIEITGHTDSVGTPEYNRKLGQARAESVRLYLQERHQLPLSNMNVVSYGEDQPAASNGTPEGRAQNRRVVVTVQ